MNWGTKGQPTPYSYTHASTADRDSSRPAGMEVVSQQLGMRNRFAVWSSERDLSGWRIDYNPFLARIQVPFGRVV